MSKILRVAMPTPLPQLFDYLPPEDATAPAVVGARVWAPYGPQTLVGVIVELAQSSQVPAEKLRPVLQILDTTAVFDSQTLALCRWTSDYYQHSFGETLHAALPLDLRRNRPAHLPTVAFWEHTELGKGLPADGLKRSPKQQQLHRLLLERGHLSANDLQQAGIKTQVARALQDKNLIRQVQQTPDAPSATRILAEAAKEPTEEQQRVLEQLRYHRFAAYLLEGATGSGKTEVYLQAIARVLAEGRQALVLVPEIGLTPLTLSRFQQRFCVPVVELHSNVAAKQRTVNWLRARTGEARIVIGTRLAVFTPMPELGIIVVDEEHDTSFKQQDGLRYSARDVAVMRAHRSGVPLILGTATPSLESLQNALSGRYSHLRLHLRPGTARAPRLECLDMRKEAKSGPFAQTTLTAIAARLEREEQVLIFLNRRGFAPAMMCEQCGWVASCRACSARLTLHKTPRHLRCHHCDARHRPPSRCPACDNRELASLGQGTERLEEWLGTEFPETPIYRADQDSMQRKGAMAELTKTLLTGKRCILVGTQMLAKGHHFPKVTLAVLLDVDQALFSGDFRALERLGQQVIQVAGRAGREALAGQVILQSHQPDHPLLVMLIEQGYSHYARTLLAERKIGNLPPYWAMALVRAESKRPENAQAFLQLAANEIAALRPPCPELKVIGPMPALLERRQERYRYLLQITAAKRRVLQPLLDELFKRLRGHALARRVRWAIDVDPVDAA